MRVVLAVMAAFWAFTGASLAWNLLDGTAAGLRCGLSASSGWFTVAAVLVTAVVMAAAAVHLHRRAYG